MGKGRLTALLSKNRLHDIQEAPLRLPTSKNGWIEDNHLENSSNIKDIHAESPNDRRINSLPISREKKVLP